MRFEMRANMWRPLAPLGVLIAIVGCGGGSVRSQLRSSDAPTAAAKAMEIYDRDHDSKLAGEELASCPELFASVQRIDTDGDGAVSKEELQARFEALDAQSDLVAVSVRVTSKGQPVPDATLTLTPAPFMGEGLQAYAGTTNGSGDCLPVGSEQELPGIPTGFYQARIVHSGRGIDVVRGCEIADDASGNRLEIAL